LFLLLFSALTIAIIVGLEVLIRKSQSRGALVFTASTTSGVGYVLNYGPQAIGVLYGLLWASIDHDVKRSERAREATGTFRMGFPEEFRRISRDMETRQELQRPIGSFEVPAEFLEIYWDILTPPQLLGSVYSEDP
jgi:hypothetical protein